MLARSTGAWLRHATCAAACGQASSELKSFTKRVHLQKPVDRSLEATGALSDPYAPSSERDAAATSREERVPSGGEARRGQQRQQDGKDVEISPREAAAEDDKGEKQAAAQDDSDAPVWASWRRGQQEAGEAASSASAAAATATTEGKPAEAAPQTRQQERTVAKGEKAAEKHDKANAAAQAAAADAKDAAQAALREQSAAQELFKERADSDGAAARDSERAEVDASWQDDSGAAPERRNVPEIKIERPAGAVDPSTLSNPPRDARERAQLAANAAAAAIQASEASSAHSAASCRAASEAAAAANAATHAVGVARGAAERHAEEELERALARVHAARTQAADAEAAAAAHAAASNAMGSVVHEQARAEFYFCPCADNVASSLAWPWRRLCLS